MNQEMSKNMQMSNPTESQACHVQELSLFVKDTASLCTWKPCSTQNATRLATGLPRREEEAWERLWELQAEGLRMDI